MLKTSKKEGVKWVCILGKRSRRRARSSTVLTLNRTTDMHVDPRRKLPERGARWGQGS